MPLLHISPRGNLGNQMLQYALAHAVRLQVPNLKVSGCNMPIWEIQGAVPPRRRLGVPSSRMRNPDIDGIADLLKSGTLQIIKYGRVPLDVISLPAPEALAEIFPLTDHRVETAGPDELLINVRGDEILAARHPDYGPLPIDFYRQLISRSGLRPVFLGQLGDDYYSKLLRHNFPTARFVPSQGILQDFQAIRTARHIVLGVSTFSWLAGWLSDAETIHMPLRGLFNPYQKTDAWLMPDGDARYRYYRFDICRWEASEMQIAALSEPHDLQQVTLAEMATLRAERLFARKAEISYDLARLRNRGWLLKLLRPMNGALR